MKLMMTLKTLLSVPLRLLIHTKDLEKMNSKSSYKNAKLEVSSSHDRIELETGDLNLSATIG